VQVVAIVTSCCADSSNGKFDGSVVQQRWLLSRYPLTDRHWLVIGVGAAVLILIFLASR